MNTQSTTQTNQITRSIDWWNGRLLIFLAGGSFILSYAAMYALAREAGITWFLVWLWPMITEAGVVIFSLALLRARLHGYDNRLIYYLILICTGLSVIFNVSHAPDDLIKRAVFALPPIFLLLAFKTLLWQVEQDTRRAGLVTTIADLAAERDRFTTELHKLRASAAAEREALTAETHTLAGQRDRLSGEIAGLREQVTDLRRQVKELDQQVTGVKSGDRSYEQARSLKDSGLTWKQVAGELAVSESTAKRWYSLAGSVNGHQD